MGHAWWPWHRTPTNNTSRVLKMKGEPARILLSTMPEEDQAACARIANITNKQEVPVATVPLDSEELKLSEQQWPLQGYAKGTTQQQECKTVEDRIRERMVKRLGLADSAPTMDAATLDVYLKREHNVTVKELFMKWQGNRVSLGKESRCHDGANVHHAEPARSPAFDWITLLVSLQDDVPTRGIKVRLAFMIAACKSSKHIAVQPCLQPASAQMHCHSLANSEAVQRNKSCVYAWCECHQLCVACRHSRRGSQALWSRHNHQQGARYAVLVSASLMLRVVCPVPTVPCLAVVHRVS